MSYLAIGAVTKALATLLSNKLNKPPLMGEGTVIRVTALPPDDDRVSADSGINLFLYRVSESPFFKNQDWHGDRLNSVKGSRPPLTLTLGYLLTAYAKRAGDTAQDDVTAHQILGNAMAIFHENPVLNDVHDDEFDANIDTQFDAELRNAFERIKVTLAPFSLEEISKIWTGLNKGYRLSVVYDVSLTQIGPTAPVPVPAPVVQTPRLRVETIATPSVTSVEPPSGPAGAAVTLQGEGFVGIGDSTVTVGNVSFAASDLTRLTATAIELIIPVTLQVGPKVPIVVSVAGRACQPAFYEVRPWLSTLQPLRGITGIPLTIPYVAPSGATVSVEIDGTAVTPTVDASAKTVTAIVPQSITTNGPKAVVLIVNDGAAKRSNARMFEVMPLITDVAVTSSPAPVSATFTLTGERLAAAAAGVVVGGLHTRAAANANATQLVVQIDRAVAAGAPIYAVIDGRQSNTLPSTLDRVEPTAAFPGDPVTLVGQGLSGRNVSVSFGAVTVAVGPQASATRFPVTVPASLAAGAVQVQVTIDSRVTNAQQLTVLG